MILCMISIFTLSCTTLIIVWYCQKGMISYMNSFFLWDHIWYHNFVGFPTFLALFLLWYCLTYHIKSLEISYDISNLWSDPWSDISNFWWHSHVISRISWYVSLYMAPVQGDGGVGGARRQALHLRGLAIIEWNK